VWYRLAERYEWRAVERASLFVVNTQPAREAMRVVYPEIRAPIIAAMNGHDEEEVPRVARGRRFTLAYAGSIYLDRDPRLLFRAAARVVRELGLRPEDFGIEFIGNAESYGGVPVSEMARQEGLEGYVTVGPHRPRRAAMEFLAHASMLVSLPQDSDMAIPSKIYEYTLYDAWLLALAHRGSAVEMVLRGSGADVVSPDDVDGIAQVLRERYRQHAAGVRPEPLASGGRFSRREQAAVLFDAIARCVAPAASTAAGATDASAAAGGRPPDQRIADAPAPWGGAERTPSFRSPS
jgi:hypothetical protein